jgi:hypothetical protein
MDEEKPPLCFEEMNIVDHFDTSVVHVYDSAAHQMLIHKYPARLVDERRISGSFIGRLNKNYVIFYPEDSVPRNECGRFAPSVFNVNAHSVRVRLSNSKNEISKSADAVPDLSDTDGFLQ